MVKQIQLTKEEQEIVERQCSLCPHWSHIEGCLYQDGEFPQPIEPCWYYDYGDADEEDVNKTLEDRWMEVLYPLIGAARTIVLKF